MDISLAGRTAVVTGGSKGIGLAVVRRLAASGAQVITGAQSQSPEIEALTRDKQVIFAEVDLADPGGPAELVAMAGDRVDILVNNVGSARARPGGFLSITEDDWAEPDPESDGRRPRDPRGAAGNASRSGRRHRHDVLGQRAPARPDGP